MITLAATTLTAAGCGGGSNDDPATTQRISITPGAAPSVRDCGFEDARSLERAARGGGEALEAPAAGTYRYRTTGSETVPSEGRRKLPATTELAVTPPRRSGSLTCIGLIRTWSDRLTTSEVYVLRGEDLYITGIGLDTPNEVQSAAPRPAILALSGSGTTWKGSFGGETSGNYTMEIVGRRTMDVGGERVRAVGVESNATYTGEAAGSRRTTTWLAIDRSLVLADEGEQTLKVGGGEERLSYRTQLKSLEAGR